MKAALGIIIGFALGFGCRYFGIPSPAPPVLFGALLVLAMTIGYTVTGRLLTMRAAKMATAAVPPDSSAQASKAA